MALAGDKVAVRQHRNGLGGDGKPWRIGISAIPVLTQPFPQSPVFPALRPMHASENVSISEGNLLRLSVAHIRL